MKTFLVTGGCGFIGSHLCEALLDRGHAVRVLDDLSSGFRGNLPDAAEFVRGDIAEPATARTALEGVDGCFHLAAIASVERGLQDWLGTHRVNLTGTITLLDEIRRFPPSRRIPFVYASSAAVYGDCEVAPVTEASAPRPLSAYGADKLGCELHARAASVVHGIPTTGLRFFNVFGPRQDPKSAYSGVISIFCDRLRRGEPVDVFGDGQQTRDFVFVRDVVNALIQAMTVCPPDAPVFNVCTGHPTSVLGLARSIADLCGVPLQTRLRPARSGEIRHSLGSRARARALLGLPDPVGLREGLTEVLAWSAGARSTERGLLVPQT
jgi:UDP-glucose 4-epimerase